MRVETREGSRERTVLTGMITSKRVLSHIAPKWNKEGLFNSKWSDIIAGWCVRYFQKYNAAPRQDIENYFNEWAERTKDSKTVEIVERFLGDLSGNYTKNGHSPESVIELATNYFNSVRVQKLGEALIGEDWEEGTKLVRKFEPITLVQPEEVDVFNRTGHLAEALLSNDEEDILVQYYGTLGRFFKRAFERDSLVGFTAPEKVGKTFLLMDIAWNAMIQRRRVAFFELGDLSRKQTLRRFGARAARKPIKPDPYYMPYDIGKNKDGEVIVKRHKKKPKACLSYLDAIQALQRTQKEELKSKRSFFRLIWRPAKSITVAEIANLYREWKRQGWQADVIVIDYADILANPAGIGDSWEAINENWTDMRKLSQEMEGLVVTATQANAASYSAERIGRKHFSGNKLKYAHVTAMYGISQTVKEKANGLFRLNTLALREDEFVESAVVHCAHCFAIADPFVKVLY